MLRRVVIAASALAIVAACTPSRALHGYQPDEARPSAIEPGVDTRSSVLARLGTPSTKSIFDDNTWIYMSTIRQRQAFFKPKVTYRDVVAIRFDADNQVSDVLQYDLDDGEIVQYASRETPTRGRELGILEQIFGTVGIARLPGSEEITPGDPTGRGGR